MASGWLPRAGPATCRKGTACPSPRVQRRPPGRLVRALGVKRRRWSRPTYPRLPVPLRVGRTHRSLIDAWSTAEVRQAAPPVAGWGAITTGGTAPRPRPRLNGGRAVLRIGADFSSLPSNPWENLGLRCTCDHGPARETGCLVTLFACQAAGCDASTTRRAADPVRPHRPSRRRPPEPTRRARAGRAVPG
jgi:hypothetical protein